MRLKNRVEELEIENKSLWRAITNYETHYRDLCDEMKKEIKQQEETIKVLLDVCRPMVEDRLKNALGEINDLLEKELKNLIDSEKAKTSPKAEKITKARAKKTEKVDEPKKEAKTEKKSKKKGDTK